MICPVLVVSILGNLTMGLLTKEQLVSIKNSLFSELPSSIQSSYISNLPSGYRTQLKVDLQTEFAPKSLALRHEVHLVTYKRLDDSCDAL